MADLYWVSFRIAKDATRQKRYDGLIADLQSAAVEGTHWKDPTSFILFRSALTIGRIATLVKGAINEQTDIAVIGKPEKMSARVVGKVEDPDLFELWDWIEVG